MELEQAKKELPDFASFCSMMCNCWCRCDWYCPTPCKEIEKAEKIDFERIQNCYARHDGDMTKVVRYIRSTKINRGRGGY